MFGRRSAARIAAWLLLGPLWLLGGCEHAYTWETAAPPVQDAVLGMQCGGQLEGYLQWSQYDGSTFPDSWDELCAIDWVLDGQLTSAYDPESCYSCRCVYEVHATLSSDECGWYDDSAELDLTIGLTPTARGPEKMVPYAADWPWLGYTDLIPSYEDDPPQPSDEVSLVYLGQEDEGTLAGDYDANEIYLASNYYWGAPNGTDAMYPRAWLGLSY